MYSDIMVLALAKCRPVLYLVYIVDSFCLEFQACIAYSYTSIRSLGGA